MGEGIFTAETEFDRPVFTKLFADRDIRCRHMFIITEGIVVRGPHIPVSGGVSCHVIVG